MAIQHTITQANSNYGVAFTNAYHRIITATVLRNEGTIKFEVTLDVAAYADPSAINPNTKEVKFQRFNVDLTTIESTAGDDFLSKCYTWVMTQMSGSTAV